MARKSVAAPGKTPRKTLTQRAAKSKRSKPAAGANVFEQPRNLGGRPTKYDPKYVDQVAKLCGLGATDEEIASFFEVCKMTIIRWREQYADFAEATRTGKETADERVERSLFQMAVGYEHPAVKIFQDNGEPIYAAYREHVPANVSAAIFWLKNRRRETWRDKQEVEHSGGIALNVTPEDASL